MSDSDESGVTYMEVSSPFEDLSDIGSPRADDHEYLELPETLEDPYVEAALLRPFRGHQLVLTRILAQMSEIRELHDADRRRQAVISEMLRADQRRST
ncbi:hypothetical protein Tco_0620770 [Tanacetum coccineum]